MSRLGILAGFQELTVLGPVIRVAGRVLLLLAFVRPLTSLC